MEELPQSKSIFSSSEDEEDALSGWPSEFHRHKRLRATSSRPDDHLSEDPGSWHHLRELEPVPASSGESGPPASWPGARQPSPPPSTQAAPKAEVEAGAVSQQPTYAAITASQRGSSEGKWQVVSNRRQRPKKPRPDQVSSRYPVIIKPADNPAQFSKLGSWRQAQLIKDAVGPVDGIRQTPTGEWLISCTSEKQQGQLLRTSALNPDRSLSILTRIPKTIVVGVVKGVPLDDDAEKLLKADLEAQDLPIDAVKRLTSRDGGATGSVRVAFLMASLPSYVKLGYTRHQVVPYVAPVRRCSKCQLLGHSRKECRRKTPRCARCGKGHPTQECKEEQLFCINCCGNHSAAYPRCPEVAIRRVAHEIKNQRYVTFSEALVTARDRWSTHLKDEWARDRDFAAPPKPTKPQVKESASIPPSAPPEAVLPCGGPKLSKGIENGSTKSAKPARTPSPPPVAASAEKKKAKKRKAKRDKGAAPPQSDLEDATPTIPAPSPEVPDHESSEVCEMDTAPSTPTPPPSSSETPLARSIGSLQATVKSLQEDLARTSPQAAKLLDGIFVILRTIVEIADHGGA